MPTGITCTMPPAWPTRAGSRQCSGNDAVPAAVSCRSSSVATAIADGRAPRSHGSPMAARSRCSRPAAYSCATAPPMSTASKYRPRVKVRRGPAPAAVPARSASVSR